jgi:hypothetical protein
MVRATATNIDDLEDAVELEERIKCLTSSPISTDFPLRVGGSVMFRKPNRAPLLLFAGAL